MSEPQGRHTPAEPARRRLLLLKGLGLGAMGAAAADPARRRLLLKGLGLGAMGAAAAVATPVRLAARMAPATLTALTALTTLPARHARASQPGPVREVGFDWHDTARDREVPALLHLPAAEPPAGRPWPVVVFSHGLGGSRHGYRHLGTHWAAHGFASLHVQHVGSDRRLWRGDGNPLALWGRIGDAASEAEAIARTQDLRFALDRLLTSDRAPAVDDSRCIVAGHSYGANTALLSIGARLQRQGQRVGFTEPRFKAAILISAPPFHGEGDPTAIVGGIRVPTLHITATGDDIRIPGYFSDHRDRIALFEATGGPRKLLAVYEGGSHSMFTDRMATGGFELNRRVKAATQALTLAFLRSVTDGDDLALREWPEQHRELLARFSGPAPGQRGT
jgi:dienelactone hydrolase